MILKLILDRKRDFFSSKIIKWLEKLDFVLSVIIMYE